MLFREALKYGLVSWMVGVGTGRSGGKEGQTVTGCCADKLQDESIASLVDRPWVLPASPAACSPLTRPACLACLPGLPAWPACRYDLANARDQYRFACGPDGGNKRLLLRYIEVGCGCTAMGRGGAVLGWAGRWLFSCIFVCGFVCLGGDRSRFLVH
jgi:hypothetical protein